MTRRALPKAVAELAEVIGRDDALTLIGSLPQCGSRDRRRMLYVPAKKRIGVDHPIAIAIGLRQALKLQRFYAGCIVELPTCAYLSTQLRIEAVIAELDAGRRPEAIAVAYRMTHRRVVQIAKSRQRQ